MAIVGIARLREVRRQPHKAAWREHHLSLGLSRAEFNSYLDGSAFAYLLLLHRVSELDEPCPCAVDAGVTFFDTADMYSGGVSEEVTGRLLAKLFARRSDYVLATKVFYPMGSGSNDRGLSRKHIMDSVDASLRRLGTDHIDLYQIHRWDTDTPIEETMAALHDVVRSGPQRRRRSQSGIPVPPPRTLRLLVDDRTRPRQ